MKTYTRSRDTYNASLSK